MVFLARLQMQAFRSFEDAELTFSDPRTLIVGRNATGKSTIADAIAWCLTGRCRGLDGAGRGVSGLIRSGASRMRVRVDLMTDDGPMTVVREADAPTRATALAIGTSEADLRRGGVAEVQALIYERLGAPAAVWQTACDATAFFALDHAEAKDLLLRLLDVRVDVDGVSVPLDEIDAMHRSADLERAAAKKALASRGSLTPPPIPLQPPADQLREKAAALREQIASARDDQAEARGRLAELTRRRGEISRGLDTLRGSCRVVGPDAAGSLALAEQVLAHAISQRDELATQEPAPFVGHQIAPEWITRVQAHDPKDGCVFSASIPCKTAVSHFRTYVQQAHADVKQHAAVEQARASWRDRMAQHDREIDKLTREVTSKRTELARSEEVSDLIHQAEAKLAAVVAEIASLEMAPAQEGSDSAAKNALALVEKQLATWQEYDRVHNAFLAHKDATAKLKAEIVTLEARCQQTGPKGARVAALASALDAWTSEVNAVAARWGFTFAITPDPWAVTVNGRDVALLSVSERLRVGVALQLAIVHAAGLGLAIVDGVDLLDRANNLELSRVLLAHDACGQAIIAATREDDAPLPQMDGLQVVRLLSVDGASVIHDVTMSEVA